MTGYSILMRVIITSDMLEIEYRLLILQFADSSYYITSRMYKYEECILKNTFIILK